MILRRDPDNPEAEMGFFDHIEALRWHLIRAAAAVVICSSLAGYYYELVFNKIILGVGSKDFPTYKLICWVSEKIHIGKDLCMQKDVPIHLLDNTMFGQITIIFQYCIIVGLIASFPYIIWELWRFAAPALSDEEQKKTSRVIMACSVFFYIGIAFCYFIIIPFSVNFAMTFSINANAITKMTSLDNYIDNFTVMLLAVGAVFELPMIVYFLSKLGILSAETMRNKRRYAIVIILIAAGVITPSPDLFTQCLVAVPVYILYEFSIFIAARNERNELLRNTA